MDISQYINVFNLPNTQDYKLAEQGEGFIIPGLSAIASISPREPINYVALLHYVEGFARANHYHTKKHEYLFILDGTLQCEFYDPNDIKNLINMTVGAGKVIYIKPGCAHRFTAVAGEASVLELSPQKLDLSDQIAA